MLLALPSFETMKIYLRDATSTKNQANFLELMHQKISADVIAKSAKEDQNFMS